MKNSIESELMKIRNGKWHFLKWKSIGPTNDEELKHLVENSNSNKVDN